MSMNKKDASYIEAADLVGTRNAADSIKKTSTFSGAISSPYHHISPRKIGKSVDNVWYL